MNLPDRMKRIAERITVPNTVYNFKWMQPVSI